MKDTSYGVGDASYQAAGQREGLTVLVDRFYDLMDGLPEAKKIRSMHPADLQISRDKLVTFLCGWLGGPKKYAQTYGPIHIPRAHSHLDIGIDERDAWLLCMNLAVAEQPYTDQFKQYLMQQLYVPAERIRVVSQAQQD